MKKSNFVLALAATLAFGANSSVFAANMEDAGLGHAVDASLIVTRTAAMGASAVVGTPVAVAKHSFKDYLALTSDAADKIGGHNFAPACLLVSVGTIPMAMVSGSVKGTVTGGKHAVGGFEKPFNKSSFGNELMTEQ